MHGGFARGRRLSAYYREAVSPLLNRQFPNMHHSLREIAKIGVGLVAADLVAVFWFSTNGFFPLTLLGVTWGASAIAPIVVFDLALIVLLAHYGWSMRLPISSPSERALLLFAGAIFCIVALAHLVRVAFNLRVILGGAILPMWLSWVGIAIAAYLSYSSFHFALRGRR